MISEIIAEIGKHWILVVVCVLAAVAVSAYVTLRTKEFSWDKKTIRAYAILYNLDKRGLISVTLLMFRLIFICYIAVSGGSTSIVELAIIEFMTLLYAFISGDKKSFSQLIAYLVIYIIILMESLFYAYYTEVESTFTIMFLVISFGLFASLYSIHQAIVAYERLIITCAERDREKYDKDTENNRGNKFGGESVE